MRDITGTFQVAGCRAGNFNSCDQQKRKNDKQIHGMMVKNKLGKTFVIEV